MLSAIGEYYQGKSETIGDLESLDTAYLARYKPNANGNAGWQCPGSSNYTVGSMPSWLNHDC